MYVILFVSVLCVSSNVLATAEFDVEEFLTRLRNVPSRALFDVEKFLNNLGYDFENHEVTTEDGYILELHRIPRNRNESENEAKTKPAVLIMHGLLSSSIDFFILGSDHSLALSLVDQGYDVWLGNNRGNTRSRKHTSLDPDNATFWDFSFHELGVYDDAAIIDYIIDKIENKTISYIGHSQGTTQFFALAATKPEYNKYVNLMVALGPSAYQQNLTNPLIQIVKDYYTVFDLLTGYLNLTEILPHSDVLTLALQYLCDDSSSLNEVCVGIISAIVGFDSDQVDRSALATIFENFPAGTSLKEYKHFLQLVKSGYFRPFDYGIIKNVAIYNKTSPPDYDTSLITTPVALYYGQNDLLVGIPDVERLAGELPNLVEKHMIEYEKFNHADFIFAKDVSSILYFYVINLLNQYNGLEPITSTTTTTTTPAPTTPTTSTPTTTTTSPEPGSNTTITGSTDNSNVTTEAPQSTTSSASSVYNFLQIFSIYIVLMKIKVLM